MEGLEDQLPTLVGEEVEEEAKLLEEQAEKELDRQEGLVQQLGPRKECGGLLLRNFPEREGDKKTGKRELLMMVMVLSNLVEEEEKNKIFQNAEIETRRTEREGKQMLDLKISLEKEDLLENSCKQ